MIDERGLLEDALLSAWISGPVEIVWSRLAHYEWADRGSGALFRALSASTGAPTGPELVEAARRAGEEIEDTLHRVSLATPSLLQTRDVDRLLALQHRDSVRKALARADQAASIGDMSGVRAALESVDATDHGVRLQATTEVVGAALEALANPSRGTTLGVEALASEVGQLPPGAVLTIGGYTGTGKSSLALLLAFRAQPAVKVGILSVEDPMETWGQRLLALVSGVPAEAIQRRTITVDQRERLEIGAPKMRDVNILWSCSAGVGADRGVAIAEQMAAEGATLLVIDYLQAFRTSTKTERYDAVSDLFKALKGVAARRGCSIIMLSQLSRPERGGEFREPRMSQLKESGDIENESEAILLLWQRGPNPTDDTNVRLAKLKWGPRGAKFTLERRNGVIVDMKRVATNDTESTSPTSYSDVRY